MSYAESFEPVAGRTSRARRSNRLLDGSGRGLKFLSEDMSKTFTASVFHITKQNALVTDPDNVYGPKLQTGEMVSKGSSWRGASISPVAGIWR